MKLADTRVILTGGSRGLGEAIAKRFHNEGANVNVLSRGNGYDVRAHLPKTHGDVLVCCAGIYGPIGPLDLCDPHEWVDCIDTNLIGVLHACQSVIPHMRQAGRGKIIIVSGGGSTRPRPNFSAYAASKAAVVRLMECIAGELAPHNITANCLAPGLLNTSIHDAVISAGPELAGKEEYANALVAKDGPVDFTKACDLAVWMAGKESDGVTGKLISIHHDYRSITA